MKLINRKLYRLNKSKDDLIHLLNPKDNYQNQPLFWKNSGDQNTFNNLLGEKNIQIETSIYPELDEALIKTQEELTELKIKNADISKTRLDFDIAKIFHKNIRISKSATNNYEFWRCVTLFYFIENVKWRWQKEPEEDNRNWASNADAIFRRSVGERNPRIDAYRFWLLGEKFFCNQKGYYYLDAMSDLVKNDNKLSVQNFILWTLENRLTSNNNRITKMLAEILFLEKKKYTEAYIEGCIKRYNAFINRLFSEADSELIKKEICLINC